MEVIAVTGATGALGAAVARRLAQRGAALRLVVRDARRAPVLPGSEVAVVEAGYDDGEGMRRALDGATTLYLVSAAEHEHRLEQHRAAVEAAAAAGVERVVYTSFLGAAPDATFTLARDHWHTEEALRGAGLRVVSLRNALYADLVPHLFSDGALRGPAGEGRVALVARADIVDVSVAALLDAAHDGAVYDVTGPEALSLHEVTDVVRAVTGQDVRYVPETVAEAYRSRERYGAPAWQVDAWVSTYTAIAAGEMAVVSDVVQRVAGHPPRTLREVLSDAPAP